MSINNSILILRANDLLPDPGTKKHLLVTKKTPATSDLFSFRKKNILRKDYLNRLSHSSQTQSKTQSKTQSIIRNRPGESGIAGVVSELWIPFGVI